MKHVNTLHERLDVFVKVLYIRAFVQWVDFEKYSALYRKHILLMNGWIEDEKKSVDDFENSFQSLIQSFQKNKFDNNFPIPLFEDDSLANGAHRFACCLYFWIEPKTIQAEKWLQKTIWDILWFKEQGFTQEELIIILKEYYNYNSEASLIILWPLIWKKLHTVKKVLSSHNIQVLWNFTLWLKNKHTFKEFIYDIYSYDWDFQSSLGIDKKAIELSANWVDVEILIVENKHKNKKSQKEDIRSEILEKIPNIPSKYYTFHSWDTQNEEKYLIDIILNENNIQKLYKRWSAAVSLDEKISEIYAYIEKQNLSIENFCIVWSWPLWVFWITEVSDIDIIFKKENASGIIKATANIDILDYQYYKDISNENLIEDQRYHFYYRGLKFLDLEILKIVKWNFWNREKDIIQAKKIEKFLFSNSHINFKTKIILQYRFLKKIWKVKFINAAIYTTKKLWIYKPVSYLWRKYILKNN